MNRVFTPDFRRVGSVPGVADIKELSQETSVYAASPEFVRKNCGPIAIGILDAVPTEYIQRCHDLGMRPNIDVRIHRLNIGELPAVPGWHCDGAFRETYFSQPDIDRVPTRDHIIATVSSSKDGVSNTQFIDQPINVSLPGDPHHDFSLWREVHKQVPQDAKTYSATDGLLHQFSVNTLHRCTPAKTRGWRLFFRISMWHNDYLGHQGKIATQQQVYILHESNGW